MWKYEYLIEKYSKDTIKCYKFGDKPIQDTFSEEI